jgi:salicylate hydroxylase
MEYHHYRTGEFLGRIEEFGEPRSRQIHRAHLVEVLKSKVPDSYISTGKRLSKIEKDIQNDCYTLNFLDGTTTTVDIIVGCDGIKSAVRSHLGFTDLPLYSGQMVYRGYVAYADLTPSTVSLLRRTVNFRGPRRHILTLPIGNEATGNDRVGIIGFMTEPLEGWKSESWLATAPVDDLAAHCNDWCPEVLEIIEGLRKSANEKGEILKQTLYVREPTEKWWSVEGEGGSGIILIGDSVHSTLPHQGTSIHCHSISQSCNYYCYCYRYRFRWSKTRHFMGTIMDHLRRRRDETPPPLLHVFRPGLPPLISRNYLRAIYPSFLPLGILLRPSCPQSVPQASAYLCPY